MEEIVHLIADITDGFVVVLLCVGMIVAISRASLSLVWMRGQDRSAMFARSFRQLRLDLGQILLLSLEILIISDILHSLIRRTMEEMGILAVTVAIRIALAFFLDRELKELRQADERDDA